MSNGASVRPAWGSREYLIVAASLVSGAVLLYAGLQLGILQFLGLRSAGDEPPITVKHGTIELNLVSSKNHPKWDKPNGKAYWEIKGGNNYSHNKPTYDVLVGYTFPTDGAGVGCKDATYASAGKVAFTYHEKDPGTGSVTATFEISKNGTTMMTPSTGFDPDVSGRTLTFGKTMAGADDGGYISEIDTDGNVWCTFDAGHQPTEIALLDGN